MESDEARRLFAFSQKATEEQLLKSADCIRSDVDKSKAKQAFLQYTDPSGNRAIHVAVTRGFLDWFQFLLEFAAQEDMIHDILDVQVASGKALIHCIVEKDDMKTLDMIKLLDEYTDDYPKDRNGRTVLHYAAVTGNPSVITQLMLFGEIQRDKNGFNPLDFAVLRGHREAVELLSAEVNWTSSSPSDIMRVMRCALISGSIEIMKYIHDEYELEWRTVDPSNGRNLLHWAVASSRELACLTFIPIFDVLANMTDKHRRTPLHLAAREDGQIAKKNCASLIAHAKSTLFSVDSKKLTPFHYAATGDGAALSELLSHVEESFDRTFFCKLQARMPKMSCLHIAASLGKEEALSGLMEFIGDKFKPNALDKNRKTALYYCTSSNSPHSFSSVVRACIQHGLRYDITKCSPLLQMIENHWEWTLFEQLRSICDENQFNSAIETYSAHSILPVHFASSCGNVEILKRFPLLLQSKDNAGNTSAHFACFHNQTKSMSYILEEHEDAMKMENVKGQVPIQLALANGSVDILQEFPFIDEYSNHIDSDGNDSLLLASCSKELSILPALIDNGANPSITNTFGHTVLHRIVSYKGSFSREIFANAVQINSFSTSFDINARDHAGCTPLHLLCIHQSRVEYMELLLKYGADVTMEDEEGNTPLHYCAFYNKTTFLKLLLSLDCIQPQVKNKKGRSPLDSAAFAGNHRGTRKLLKSIGFGVDKEFDLSHRSPIHAASIHGNISCIELLSNVLRINEIDINGRSPLSYLYSNRSIRSRELVLGMIEIGITPTPSDRKYLVSKGWVEQVESNEDYSGAGGSGEDKLEIINNISNSIPTLASPRPIEGEEEKNEQPANNTSGIYMEDYMPNETEEIQALRCQYEEVKLLLAQKDEIISQKDQKILQLETEVQVQKKQRKLDKSEAEMKVRILSKQHAPKSQPVLREECAEKIQNEEKSLNGHIKDLKGKKEILQQEIQSLTERIEEEANLLTETLLQRESNQRIVAGLLEEMARIERGTQSLLRTEDLECSEQEGQDMIIEWLEKKGIPKKHTKILFKVSTDEKENTNSDKNTQEGRECKNREQMVAAFESGQIPFGFSSSLIWKHVHQTLVSIPDEMEDLVLQKKQLSVLVSETKKTVSSLLSTLLDYQDKETRISLMVNPWIRCSNENYKDLLHTCAMLSCTEERLALVLQDHLLHKPGDFTTLNGIGIKLSLLLNAVGLPPEVITKLEDVDVFEFLDSPSSSLCNYFGIICLQDRLDLAYCQKMLSHNIVPYHLHSCYICSCNTFQDLIFMLKERGIDSSPLLGLSSTINGPRSVVLTREDLDKEFSLSQDELKRCYLLLTHLKKEHLKQLKNK